MSDTFGKLQAMAALGLPRSLVGAVLGAFLPDVLSADDRRFLEGPVIVHENGWTDTLPDWFEPLIGAERIGIVFRTGPAYIVGPVELAAVMYPATMDAPLRSELADLYVWATIHAVAQHRRQTVAEAYVASDIEPIEDAVVLQPRGRLHHVYTELAQEIRRRVVAAQEARERGQRREAREEKRNAPARDAAPEIVEFSLF